MKSLISGAIASAFVVFGTAAHADSEWYGHLAGSYGTMTFDIDDWEGEDSINSWSVDGSASIPAGDTFSFQLDASYAGVSDDEFSGDSATGSAHAIFHGDGFDVGGYVGAISTEDITAWVFGGEYAAFIGNSTVTLSAGYAMTEIEDVDDDIDLYGVNGEYRYYVTDNFRLDGRLGFQRATDGELDEDFLSYGVGGEWRPDSMPFGVIASVDRIDLQDFDASATSFQIGLRWTFGSAATLREYETEGVVFRQFGGFEAAVSGF